MRKGSPYLDPTLPARLLALVCFVLAFGYVLVFALEMIFKTSSPWKN